jgi:carboxylesterase type B
MPRAKGLFRRAIVESGGAQHATSPETALRIGRRLALKLGVDPTRSAIAGQPLDRILAAQGELRAELMQPDPAFWGEITLNGLPWEPVIDGDVLPSLPLDAIRNGSAADIDLLAGGNTEEWRLFLVPGGLIDQISSPMLMGTLAGCGLNPADGLAAYQAIVPNASPGDLLAAVMTDWYWRIPAVRAAEAHLAKPGSGRTYMYEFGWRSPQFEGRLGAAHAVEMAFAFDTLGHGTGGLLGASPPQELADVMHRAWVNFASTGDPGWPEYDLARRATMRFGTTSAVIDDPLLMHRRLWEGVR